MAAADGGTYGGQGLGAGELLDWGSALFLPGANSTQTCCCHEKRCCRDSPSETTRTHVLFCFVRSTAWRAVFPWRGGEGWWG
jgi:hypothetical protein|eukprot:COSAG06_NODE_5655_length_3340_cov_2.126196_4_plen_82_part_00